jgi:DNA-directed RNA polymerase specialized sigma24 family protein
LNEAAHDLISRGLLWSDKDLILHATTNETWLNQFPRANASLMAVQGIAVVVLCRKKMYDQARIILNSHDWSSVPRESAQFETTHWSLIHAAGKCGSTEAELALEQLCRTYWLPLYEYVRRRVPNLHDAHDLTQAFFERLLEKNYLVEADPARGRFRTFLLTAFQHFLSKEWEKCRAQRRGGGRSILSLNFELSDSQLGIGAVDDLTPEMIYERQWAITLLTRVLVRLESEMELAGKRQQFECLKGFIVGSNGDASYAETAAILEMTAPAARMAASRLRQRYRDLLHDEIAQTVSSPAEVEEEIRHLFLAFGG